MNDYVSDVESLELMLEDIYNVFFYGYGIASLGLSGIILMITVIAAVASFLFSVLIYVLEAIPVFALAKKNGRKLAWLAWVPIFGSYFRLYVLTDIPGDKEFSVFNGKIKMKSRSMSFWCYLGIILFGGALVTAIVGILSLIPGIGPIIGSASSILGFVPAAVGGIMEYVYLRDVLDIYKPDKKKNMTAAIVVTVLDNLATLGFARVIYLYTIIKNKPISAETNDQQTFYGNVSRPNQQPYNPNQNGTY